MMKTMTLMAAALAVCITLPAQQPDSSAAVEPAAKPAAAPLPAPVTLFQTNLDPAKYADQAEAARLIKQREQLILQMIQKRQEIIRKDRKAQELHQKILELQKELGVRIENKREMIELNSKLTDLDRQIDHLERKKQNSAAQTVTVPAAPVKESAPAK